eukprot:309499_1
MSTTSLTTTWLKLADMHATQQIININAHEFILIPSKLSTNIVFKYNSLTNSFNQYINIKDIIKDSKNLEINCHTVIKAAFNENIYIYSFDITRDWSNI